MQQASSAEMHIFLELVSQIILFLVDALRMAHFSLICIKISKYLKSSWKMGPYLSKKVALC